MLSAALATVSPDLSLIGTVQRRRHPLVEPYRYPREGVQLSNMSGLRGGQGDGAHAFRAARVQKLTDDDTRVAPLQGS